MAKFLGFLGSLSGKLGGNIFATNKGGSYVRIFRKPTDAKTIAQINNRATFASAVTAWHSLSDAQKAAWNSFAITNFKPKFGAPGVRFSGYNSFVSTQNIVSNMSRQAGVVTISNPTGITATFGNFINSGDAPIHPLGSQIQAHGGLPMSLILTSVVMDGATGASVIDFDLIGPTGPGPITAPPEFIDSVGDIPVGIAIVASLAVEQDEQFVVLPNLNLVAVIPPPATLTGWTTGTSIQFTVPNVTDYVHRKLGYQAGDLVQFKAFLIGENGMTQPLNAIKAAVA